MENFPGHSNFLERLFISGRYADSVADDKVVPLMDHEWFEKYGSLFSQDWEHWYRIIEDSRQEDAFKWGAFTEEQREALIDHPSWLVVASIAERYHLSNPGQLGRILIRLGIRLYAAETIISRQSTLGMKSDDILTAYAAANAVLHESAYGREERTLGGGATHTTDTIHGPFDTFTRVVGVDHDPTGPRIEVGNMVIDLGIPGIGFAGTAKIRCFPPRHEFFVAWSLTQNESNIDHIDSNIGPISDLEVEKAFTHSNYAGIRHQLFLLRAYKQFTEMTGGV